MSKRLDINKLKMDFFLPSGKCIYVRREDHQIGTWMYIGNEKPPFSFQSPINNSAPMTAGETHQQPPDVQLSQESLTSQTSPPVVIETTSLYHKPGEKLSNTSSEPPMDPPGVTTPSTPDDNLIDTPEEMDSEETNTSEVQTDDSITITVLPPNSKPNMNEISGIITLPNTQDTVPIVTSSTSTSLTSHTNKDQDTFSESGSTTSVTNEKTEEQQGPNTSTCAT